MLPCPVPKLQAWGLAFLQRGQRAPECWTEPLASSAHLHALARAMRFLPVGPLGESDGEWWQFPPQATPGSPWNSLMKVSELGY